MSLVEVTDGGYNTIIRFNEEEFSKSKGKVRRWIYENTITPARLSRLAFRGAEIKEEYEKIHKPYLYNEN